MISLDKVRLINWHLFANEAFDVKNITFLTGANGTGKSTVIDALQIVLLGDTSGHNFNKAANDRTGRTLRGYLRCETGETADGQVMCLRPGRFTSYIALQFTDTKDGTPFTLGIVFDSFEDETEEHHFFYLNSVFPSNDFSNKDLLDASQPRPLTYKEFASIISQGYKPADFRFFDTSASYQEFIRHKLGDMPDKYFTLFKKAVGFSPITNISSFITEFVCDVDYSIDISPMQNNIEQYKLLELEAKKVQLKIESLNGIHAAYEDFKKVQDNLIMADYLTDRANYETYKAELQGYNDKLSSSQARIVEIDGLLKDKDSQIEDLKSTSEGYLAKKVGSAGYSLSASLAAKKNAVLEKIASLNQNYSSIAATLTSYGNQYKENLSQLFQRVSTLDRTFLSEQENEDIDAFLDASKEFTSAWEAIEPHLADCGEEPKQIEALQSEMGQVHTEAIRVCHVLDSAVFSLTKTRDDLDRELSEIEEGHKPFNQTYLSVRQALEDALAARHSGAKVSSYCDLVDISDKKWSLAIEAVIFNQKFNFFVEEAYYEEASRLLASICREYNYYQVSVIDTKKLIEHGFSSRPGSVAEEIETEHSGARAYTDFLLGSVMKCETFAEARESGNGLLPDATGYRSFASFYLNRQKGQVSFIGTSLDANTVLRKKDDFASLNKTLEIYNDLNSYFRQIAKLEVLSSSETQTFCHDIADMKNLDKMNEEVAKYDEEMKEGSLNEVSSFDDKISAIEQDIKNLEAEKEKLLLEKGGLEQQVLSLKNDLIPAKENSLTFMGGKLMQFDPSLVESKFAPFYDKAKETLPMDKIKAQAQVLYVQTQNKLKASKDKLIDLRSKYTTEYHLSYDNMKEENNEEFERELSELSTVLLPNYLAKIEEAHKKATKEFKDDFIYKLRASFETIRSQIDELNQALKSVVFGRDSYRFSVEPNKDYLEYYNMITDDLLLNVGDAEDTYLEKYKDAMNNLFNLISDATDQEGDVKAQILQNVQKFTDYRTYLVFDLLVKRGQDAAESSLARTFKRQSGGETQTPFYISILASFAQLYRTSDPSADTFRLVIFDEAFSKMDGARIKESVGLLRSFGLQAILSTPSEKLRDLSNDVDLILVAIHDNGKNRSYIDRYEDIARRQMEANKELVIKQAQK